MACWEVGRLTAQIMAIVVKFPLSETRDLLGNVASIVIGCLMQRLTVNVYEAPAFTDAKAVFAFIALKVNHE